MEITDEKYESIIKMMSSTDDENKVVALTIIDQLTFKDNVTKILLLKKHSTSTKELWAEHAPSVYEAMKKLTEKGLLDVDRHLTYKQVLRTILTYKVPPKEVDFFFSDFGNYMTQQAKQLYPKLESIELLIKYNDDEQAE